MKQVARTACSAQRYIPQDRTLQILVQAANMNPLGSFRANTWKRVGVEHGSLYLHRNMVNLCVMQVRQ
jgi:hypothetical protein